mmetsp:Transcript_20039/g.49863  ORF Transcript_20039/g.49863 Transcript_20039/m.49863 type:complete len:268 (+) Transcript_20039:632-1435(+)
MASPAPWLKPASTTLLGAAPRASCSATSSRIHAVASSTPPHFQEGIGAPPPPPIPAPPPSWSSPSRGGSSRVRSGSRMRCILGSNHAATRSCRPPMRKRRGGALGRMTWHPPRTPRTSSSVSSLQCFAASAKPWRKMSVLPRPGPRSCPLPLMPSAAVPMADGVCASFGLNVQSCSRHCASFALSIPPAWMRRFTRRTAASTSRSVTLVEEDHTHLAPPSRSCVRTPCSRKWFGTGGDVLGRQVDCVGVRTKPRPRRLLEAPHRRMR